MVRQVCLYLTRRCNLKCRYCEVVKNPKDEMSTKEIKKALDVIIDEIKPKPEFLVLFGGEPLIRKDLQEILDYIGDRIDYTIISNSVLPFDYTGVTSLTASIDTEQGGNTDDAVKSSKAFNRLLEAKEKGIDNLVANIIAHDENYLEIPKIIEKMTSYDIWSIVGIVHCGKGDWKFRSTTSDLKLSQKNAEWLSKELSSMKKSGKFLLHNSLEYLEGIKIFASTLDWKCSKPYYLTIDCDGGLIACNDRWGEEVSKMTIFDFDQKKWEEAWKKDVKECSGCYYNHQVQVEGGTIRRW